MKRLLLILVLVACSPKPPAIPTPPGPVEVSAGFDVTWESVIDHFAESNIPIRTIEKASGLIATDRLRVDAISALEYADCGRTGNNFVYVADWVIYNVLVRGDEQRSTVRVTANWEAVDGPFTCSTRGVWEEQTQEVIRARAER